MLLALALLRGAGPGDTGCGALAGGGSEPALRLHSSGGAGGAGQLVFGTPQFALTFESASLALLNVTTCAPAGREQGFLWPAPQVERFSLWQLNYSSDCSAGAPGGHQLDALGSASASRNHSLDRTPDGRSVLTLRWTGIATEPSAAGGTMDVVVTVSMSAGSSQAALRGSVAVHGAAACVVSMTLPNFERLVLRSPARDKIFTPWFFGQVGDQSNLCGGGDCTLELGKVPPLPCVFFRGLKEAAAQHGRASWTASTR